MTKGNSLLISPPHSCVLWTPARGLKLEQRWCFQIICLPGVGTDIIRSQWTPYQAFHQDIRTHVSESRFAWRGVFPPTCQKTDRRGFLCKQRVCHTRPYPASCSLPLHEISNMGSGHMKAAPRQYCTNFALERGFMGDFIFEIIRFTRCMRFRYIYGTGYVFLFSVVWWRPFQSFKSFLACTHKCKNYHSLLN